MYSKSKFIKVSFMPNIPEDSFLVKIPPELLNSPSQPPDILPQGTFASIPVNKPTVVLSPLSCFLVYGVGVSFSGDRKFIYYPEYIEDKNYAQNVFNDLKNYKPEEDNVIERVDIVFCNFHVQQNNIPTFSVEDFYSKSFPKKEKIYVNGPTATKNFLAKKGKHYVKN